MLKVQSSVLNDQSLVLKVQSSVLNVPSLVPRTRWVIGTLCYCGGVPNSAPRVRSHCRFRNRRTESGRPESRELGAADDQVSEACSREKFSSEV